ncbi:MAG: DNA polymerase III subunit epsilon [Alphaproteobacteria bacterium]|nr:DNA polymerase III subunit epsilon [Alphaproteobacteria bacterium]
MREIALDTETTGLSYIEGDRIVEIGCVEIIDKKITGKSYHVYLNPGREMSSRAREITGLNDDFLKKQKPFEDECNGFLDFIQDSRLVIHNAPFDVGFLNFELSRIGLQTISMYRVLDTLAMAKEKFPGSPSTLDALCKRFSVEASKRTKHGALIDAELLAEVYLHMSVELKQNNIFGYIKNDDKILSESIRKEHYEPRHFDFDQNDYEAHLKFLEKIKDSLWTKNDNAD